MVTLQVDIRQFNRNGFRISGPNQGDYRLGDERLKICGSSSAVMEPLQRAWGSAFQECPGQRSAF